MIIMPSALKHGVTVADVSHAWRLMMRSFEFDYDGELRIFVIGPRQDGGLIEIVAVPASTPQRIIHAQPLRPRFHRYL